jgi:hypothetical protein
MWVRRLLHGAAPGWQELSDKTLLLGRDQSSVDFSQYGIARYKILRDEIRTMAQQDRLGLCDAGLAFFRR